MNLRPLAPPAIAESTSHITGNYVSRSNQAKGIQDNNNHVCDGGICTSDDTCKILRVVSSTAEEVPLTKMKNAIMKNASIEESGLFHRHHHSK